MRQPERWRPAPLGRTRVPAPVSSTAGCVECSGRWPHWTAWTCGSSPASCSPCSGRRVAARPPHCACSPDSISRPRVRCSSTARTCPGCRPTGVTWAWSSSPTACSRRCARSTTSPSAFGCAAPLPAPAVRGPANCSTSSGLSEHASKYPHQTLRRTAAASGPGPRAGDLGRGCCCSTSRCPRSTRRCASSCATRSGASSSSSASPPCSSHTTRKKRCPSPTGSGSCAPAASSSARRRRCSTTVRRRRSSPSSSAR